MSDLLTSRAIEALSQKDQLHQSVDRLSSFRGAAGHATIRIGSEQHKDLFCRMLLDTFGAWPCGPIRRF
jgi:hypothetical protein